MPSTELVIFDDPEDRISSSPFEGVFETKTQREILEEMLSDPFRPYTPTEISELLGKKFRTLREAFTKLERLRLIIKDNSDSQRPKYRINNDSHRILAMSFYLLAQNDDKFETDTMKMALKRYCRKEFPEMMYPSGTILMERMIIIPEGRVPYFRSEEQTTSNDMIMEGRT